MKFALSILLFIGAFSILAPSQETSAQFPANGANYKAFPLEKPPLLPKPQELKWGNKSIHLTNVSLKFPTPDKTLYPEQMKLIVSELKSFLGSHKVQVTKDSSFVISFQKGDIKTEAKNGKCRAESYALKVTPSGAQITASDTKGFYYGLKTLQQLILRRGGETSIATCDIKDWPDFEIRGFMNDVGRNYMPLDLIHQELDSMAQMKLNVYHFHFTEGPGWRLQSKLYPELNSPDNMTRMPGKIYTQEEFIQLVEYCRLRNIQLIPEMDMPGHSAAFRKALKVQMKDPKATKALVELIKEMCELVPADKMPIVHIGTDEVRGADEQINNDILKQYIEAVEACGRTPMVWKPGLSLPGYNGAIQQLWSGRQNGRAWPDAGVKYVDSLETYVNHLDPFEVAMTMYFRRPCPFKQGEGLGMILCSWPDLEIKDPRNQVLQTPMYSGMAFVSESLWNNPHQPVDGDPNQDELMKYFSDLPTQDDSLLKGFAEYENRVLAIRDRFFKNKEFNYVRQANIPWKLLGPIPNGGNTAQEFGPEKDAVTNKKLADSYTINGKTYTWSNKDYTGATIIFKHYCDFPTLFNDGRMGTYPYKNHTYYAQTYIYSPKNQTVPFWISGHTWATSDWRNGPVSIPGKWFHADPKFFVNGKEIPAPNWAVPNRDVNKNEVMVDENYHFRTPTMIPLNKGWNTVLVKSPSNNSARRWMFTFVPVQVNPKTPGCNVKEYPGLKFATSPHGN